MHYLRRHHAAGHEILHSHSRCTCYTTKYGEFDSYFRHIRRRMHYSSSHHTAGTGYVTHAIITLIISHWIRDNLLTQPVVEYTTHTPNTSSGTGHSTNVPVAWLHHQTQNILLSVLVIPSRMEHIVRAPLISSSKEQSGPATSMLSTSDDAERLIRSSISQITSLNIASHDTNSVKMTMWLNAGHLFNNYDFQESASYEAKTVLLL